MDNQAIFPQISYRKGHLLTIPSNPSDQPKRHDVMVIRYEVDTDLLLVRSAIGAPALVGTMAVLIDAWGKDALYRFMGTIAEVAPNQHDEFILSIKIEDVDSVQRRSDSRYTTRYPATFIPTRKQDVEIDLTQTQHSVGHATNISLGGMQLESDDNLPDGCFIQCNVAAPGGTLHILGRIVSKRGRSLAGFQYGLEFVRFDNLTSQRLNRLVLRIERTGRRRVRSPRLSDPATPTTKRGGGSERRRRTTRGRWER